MREKGGRAKEEKRTSRETDRHPGSGAARAIDRIRGDTSSITGNGMLKTLL